MNASTCKCTKVAETQKRLNKKRKKANFGKEIHVRKYKELRDDLGQASNQKVISVLEQLVI